MTSAATDGKDAGWAIWPRELGLLAVVFELKEPTGLQPTPPGSTKTLVNISPVNNQSLLIIPSRSWEVT